MCRYEEAYTLACMTGLQFLTLMVNELLCRIQTTEVVVDAVSMYELFKQFDQQLEI
jgi:hypothetical protein